MPSEWQHGPGLGAALPLVLLLGGAHVDGAEDRGRDEQDRDGADQAGRSGRVGEVLARDADERERQRPDGEDAAADVEGVHAAESYRSFTEESQAGGSRSPGFPADADALGQRPPRPGASPRRAPGLPGVRASGGAARRADATARWRGRPPRLRHLRHASPPGRVRTPGLSAFLRPGPAADYPGGVTLKGPSKTIVVEPVERPAEQPEAERE